MIGIMLKIEAEFDGMRIQNPSSRDVGFTLDDGKYSYDCYFDSFGYKEVIVINNEKPEKSYDNVSRYLTDNCLGWNDIRD